MPTHTSVCSSPPHLPALPFACISNPLSSSLPGKTWTTPQGSSTTWTSYCPPYHPQSLATRCLSPYSPATWSLCTPVSKPNPVSGHSWMSSGWPALICLSYLGNNTAAPQTSWDSQSLCFHLHLALWRSVSVATNGCRLIKGAHLHIWIRGPRNLAR